MNYTPAASCGVSQIFDAPKGWVLNLKKLARAVFISKDQYAVEGKRFSSL